MLFGIKPSTLGFTALRTPFHRDPYHWAPPTWGDPYPQLPLHFSPGHCYGETPHPSFSSNPPLLGLRDIPASRGISQIGEGSTTLINLYENQNSRKRLTSLKLIFKAHIFLALMNICDYISWVNVYKLFFDEV